MKSCHDFQTHYIISIFRSILLTCCYMCSKRTLRSEEDEREESSSLLCSKLVPGGHFQGIKTLGKKRRNDDHIAFYSNDQHFAIYSTYRYFNF